jgi:hypothetical protein
VSAYIADLNAGVERDRARWEEKKRAETEAATQAARERLTPLEERLARLLATIPDELKQDGLELKSLQASLRGRWRGKCCHPGELGAALRKLGFVRKRSWDGDAGFRALWYPRP